MRERLTQLVSLAVLFGVWAALAEYVGRTILPGPQDVVGIFVDLVASARVFEPLLASLGRAAAGFLLAFAIGLAYGIAAARSPVFADYSFIVFNMALFAPSLVVIFVILAMVGTDSQIPVILIAGVVVSPSVGVYMRDVMRDIDQDILLMVESYKLSPARKVVDVYVPYLIPSTLAVSRIGFNMSWKVVMLSEIFGFPGGLGFQIRNNFTAFNIPTLLAWLGVFIIALLVIEQVIRLAERRIVRWA